MRLPRKVPLSSAKRQVQVRDYRSGPLYQGELRIKGRSAVTAPALYPTVPLFVGGRVPGARG